ASSRPSGANRGDWFQSAGTGSLTRSWRLATSQTAVSPPRPHASMRPSGLKASPLAFSDNPSTGRQPLTSQNWTLPCAVATTYRPSGLKARSTVPDHQTPLPAASTATVLPVAVSQTRALVASRLLPARNRADGENAT